MRDLSEVVLPVGECASVETICERSILSLFSNLVDLAHRGMAYVRARTSFSQQMFRPTLVRMRRTESLDGTLAAQQRVFRPIHFAHAAFAELWR
jgi:hypothetical protein